MIYLGSDHGGFNLKKKIKKWLTHWGYTWEDLGNTVYDKDDDYPKFAFAVAKKIAQDEKNKAYPTPWRERPKGILCCRSAAGMVIVANKVKEVRAVAAFEVEYAKMTRLHNDSNILALAGDWTEEKKIKEIVKIWLETEFSGEERHIRRVKQIEAINPKV